MRYITTIIIILGIIFFNAQPLLAATTTKPLMQKFFDQSWEVQNKLSKQGMVCTSALQSHKVLKGKLPSYALPILKKVPNTYATIKGSQIVKPKKATYLSVDFTNPYFHLQEISNKSNIAVSGLSFSVIDDGAKKYMRAKTLLEKWTEVEKDQKGERHIGDDILVDDVTFVGLMNPDKKSFKYKSKIYDRSLKKNIYIYQGSLGSQYLDALKTFASGDIKVNKQTAQIAVNPATKRWVYVTQVAEMDFTLDGAVVRVNDVLKCNFLYDQKVYVQAPPAKDRSSEGAITSGDAATVIGLQYLISLNPEGVTTLNSQTEESSRISSRDATRLSDIKQIQTALELYFGDRTSYPSGSGLVLGVANTRNLSSMGFSSSASEAIQYIANVPSNPTPGGESYLYTALPLDCTTDCTSYKLTFALEGEKSGLKSGGHIASPLGINN